jgi:hypothetical protein
VESVAKLAGLMTVNVKDAVKAQHMYNYITIPNYDSTGAVPELLSPTQFKKDGSFIFNRTTELV